ncbi:uncharacterized protein LOC117109372 [Anneissia japonica]|uniref:uncharacterized protein LOC117109372 n=1 Tax=Anneissia japonica TaxID=1529436 RepID=UPI0014257EA3|nr:uncharacterized protein LOC117109372 [Anneissia japonica]
MTYNSSHPLKIPVLLITESAVRDILKDTRRQSNLNKCVNELLNCYSGSSLSSGNGDIDFDNPVYQACYVFLYFPVLCYSTFYGLLECYNQGDFGNLLKRAEIDNCLKVCALGGGPGTDLFGVRMFLNDIGYKSLPIKAIVLDKHERWSFAFRCLISKLRNPSRLSAEYFRLDANCQSNLTVHLNSILANADLITCSKFVSAVKALPNSKRVIVKTLKRAKPGAYIFYVDNSKGGNTKYFRSVAQLANYTEVSCFERGEDNPFRLPSTEYSSILRDLSSSTWFDLNSQRNLRITFMLWRKNGQVTQSNSNNEQLNQSNKTTATSQKTSYAGAVQNTISVPYRNNFEESKTRMQTASNHNVSRQHVWSQHGSGSSENFTQSNSNNEQLNQSNKTTVTSPKTSYAGAVQNTISVPYRNNLEESKTRMQTASNHNVSRQHVWSQHGSGSSKNVILTSGRTNGVLTYAQTSQTPARTVNQPYHNSFFNDRPDNPLRNSDSLEASQSSSSTSSVKRGLCQCCILL